MTDGLQNYSKWHNEQFDKLADQIDHEGLSQNRSRSLLAG